MRLLGVVQHGGVELYELHIGYGSLGTIGHRDAVASGNDGVRCGQVYSTASTCTEHCHLSQIRVYLLLGVQHVGTIALDVGRTACDAHTQMVLGDDFNGKVMFLDIDVWTRLDGLHQSTLYLSTSVVSMVQDAEL